MLSGWRLRLKSNGAVLARNDLAFRPKRHGMSDYIGLIIFYVLTGVLLIVLAIPLMRGKIKPNGLYGFRVRATLDNSEIWYPVNAWAGKWLLVLGVVNVASAVLIPLIWPTVTLDAYAIIMSVIALGGIIFILIAGMHYANILAAKTGDK